MSKAENNKDKPPGKDKQTSTASFDRLVIGPGGHVGPYKLLSILGEGGFAVVYLAEQEKPIRRRVALKVLKPGMDSKQIIARFEAERQALALLDHPNVAHVHDAGATKNGVPYFAMEYVKGLPLTEHCNRYKLTIDERLQLFLQVCEAVQHAHHKGIIHRDIKPSNIQVCIEGKQFIPKVIDFGVAKALSQPLTEMTLVTGQGQIIGTPEYMSPEQAEMTSQDIDTRTDIYSLGVLLYKLLVGKLPFESEALREGGIVHLRQIICEESPKTPSIHLSSFKAEESNKIAQFCQTDANTLRRKINGDLDWITLKAMEKDRTRRYQTAHALAEDIQRHLDHEPVLAGPPSKIYRLRKFLRKHQAQAIRAATTAMLLICIAAIFVMYRQAVNRAQEVESLREKDIVSNAEQFGYQGQIEKAMDTLETVLYSKHVGSEARLLHARFALQLRDVTSAVKELEELLNENPKTEIAAQAHFLLARIYLESGTGQGEISATYQQKAKEHQQKGEELFESAEAYFNRAMMAGTAEESIEHLKQALKLDIKHYDSLRARALAYYALRDYHNMELDARSMQTLKEQDPTGFSFQAIALREAGRLEEAIEHHNKAIELSPKDPHWYSQRFETYLLIGDYQHALKDAEFCVECAENKSEQFFYRFNTFTTLLSLKEYEAARREYTKILTAKSVEPERLEASLQRHVFKVLGSGQPFELPTKIAQLEPFSIMQDAVDHYNRLKTDAKRLVPGVFGQSSWSPDGKQLAYGRSDTYEWQSKVSTSEAPVLSGLGGIEIVDLDSNTTRLLVSFGKDPAWSPDGKNIAFVHGSTGKKGYQEEIWIIPAKGGEPRRLADEGGWPIWVNDPNRLFFHSRKQNALFSIRTDDLTSKPESIISCPSRFPGVSPDEKYVAYEKGGELLIVDRFSGSIVTRWIPPVPVTELLLRWSANGKELSIAGSTDSDLGLWIFDVERNNAWYIYERPAISGIWSPDRKQMVIELKEPYEENWLVTLDPNIPTYKSLASAVTQQEFLRNMREHYIDNINTEMKADHWKAITYLRKLVLLSRRQYRIGAYKDTVETLTFVKKFRFELTNETNPTDMAFTAMALHKIGSYSEAQRALNGLRRLLDGGNHPRAEKYLYDTEQLLAGENSSFYQVWDCIKENRLDKARQLVKELQSLQTPKDRETSGNIQSIFKALARVYYYRGRSARHRGYGYPETFSDYEKAVTIDPNFARAYSDLGILQVTYLTADFYNKTNAFKNASRACELSDWKDFRYINALAYLYAKTSDFENAIRKQQEAIKLIPENKHSILRNCYEAQLNLYKQGQSNNNGNPCSFSSGRLVACWKLDEGSGLIAADSSGNGCVGTLRDDPEWKSSGGKFGGAIEFDGEGDYIEISNESSFDFTDEITVAAWINFTTIPGQWTAIVTKGNSAWRLSTCRDEGKFHFAITGVGLGSSWIHGEKEVSAGQWHHVAGTYDGAYVRLYVDGVEDPASPVAYDAGLITNDFNVCIGGNSEKPERCWNGLIDDVHIYSYALSQQEVNALCTGTVFNPTLQKTEVGPVSKEK